MRIRRVVANGRKRAFEVETSSRKLLFPFGKSDPKPTPRDRVVQVSVDSELGHEAFTYLLESGREGTVHVEQVLEYNQDPGYLRDLLPLTG